MACKNCDHRGYIESKTIRDGGEKTVLAQCMSCKDTLAYSNRVAHLAGEKPKARMFEKKKGSEQCAVLPFRSK